MHFDNVENLNIFSAVYLLRVDEVKTKLIEKDCLGPSRRWWRMVEDRSCRRIGHRTSKWI